MWKAIILTLLVPITAAWDLDCSNKDNGIYRYSCFAYTECVNGSKGEIRCASNEVFSPDVRLCVIPTGITWPCADIKDCKVLDNRHYADVNSGCRSYYTCRDGAFHSHSHCPRGTVFHEEKQYCNWPEHVKKPCGTSTVLA